MRTEHRRLRSLLDDLIYRARMDCMTGSPVAHYIRRHDEYGDPIPDRCLPGRMIMGRCSDSERALLATCTEKDFQDRLWK